MFRCAEDDKTWHLPFGKVMNTESLFLQDGHDLGINIDIFPMDDAGRRSIASGWCCAASRTTISSGKLPKTP